MYDLDRGRGRLLFHSGPGYDVALGLPSAIVTQARGSRSCTGPTVMSIFCFVLRTFVLS